MKILLFLLIPCLLFSANYYVDKTAGDDSNDGSSGSPWEYCPGMAGWTGSATLSAGDTVFFDNADTWTGSGASILICEGGVVYVGNSWGAGTKALFQATGTFTNALGAVRMREDHPSIATELIGFEIDINDNDATGVKINDPSPGNLTGATKRIKDCEIHNGDPAAGGGLYAIKIGATQGYDTDNIEILDNLCYDFPHSCIIAYKQYASANESQIHNVLIRGNEVHTSGHGINIKNEVINCIVEFNYVHDGTECGYNIHSDNGYPGGRHVIFRYNIANK